MSSAPGFHVEQGGPTAVVQDDPGPGGLLVRKASVSAMDNNAYVLTCPETGEQLLIDAADDAERLLALVAEGGSALARVVTTHRHHDHHGALLEVVERTGATSLAGAEDVEEVPGPPQRGLRHGEIVRVGEAELEVVHLRGHTPGSVALALTQPDGTVDLFTGDSLFPGGPGKTWSAADFTALVADLEERVFDRFPDATRVHPGHGDSTTLGTERPHLPEWRERGW